MPAKMRSELTANLCLDCSTGNNSKRGYGRLPHEDPDDNHNTQTATSPNSTAANSTVSTPSEPPVNHLTTDLFDFELTDEFSDDSEYGECFFEIRALGNVTRAENNNLSRLDFEFLVCESAP